MFSILAILGAVCYSDKTKCTHKSHYQSNCLPGQIVFLLYSEKQRVLQSAKWEGWVYFENTTFKKYWRISFQIRLGIFYLRGIGITIVVIYSSIELSLLIVLLKCKLVAPWMQSPAFLLVGLYFYFITIHTYFLLR